jgi:hypothetical protein
MLAVVEALTCFDIDRDQIDVLTLGCGDDRYVVSPDEITKGGLWHWKKIMAAAMRLQSLAVTNQARLLLGPPAVMRLDAPTFEPKIRLDDWLQSVDKLVPAAKAAVDDQGKRIADMFLKEKALPFVPSPAE